MGARQHHHQHHFAAAADDVIELSPYVDPHTQEVVYAAGDGPFADSGDPAPFTVVGGTATSGSPSVEQPAEEVQLSRSRFAGDQPGQGFGAEFSTAERAQDAGLPVRIVNGQYVLGDDDDPSPAVELSDKRFAALSVEDQEDLGRLVRSGAAQMYVENLCSTGDMPREFPTDPGGVYVHTKPTKWGDELHVVIKRDPSTGLHHAHLWTFVARLDGRPQLIDMNRWVGTPGLSAHDVHLYPGRNGAAAVLCLSPDARGGMASLADCVVRSAQWAVGMGDVVRGRRFPFRD